MDFLTWLYALFAVSGSASLTLLAVRQFPTLADSPPEMRRAVLNRMLIASMLASFGSIGLLARGVFDFPTAESLLTAAFFALLFGRSTFAILKATLRRQMTGDDD